MLARISIAWGALVSECWRSLRNPIFDTYHPELHYMRGPGPKWHEKHASSRIAVG
jgi:hypothetical protein